MMIPDWKLERYLTGDLPEGEMREIRELEKTDEIFAGRVKMMREDNAAILKKLPFERLSEKMDARELGSGRGAGRGAGMNGAGNGVNFRLVKFAAAAALVLAVVSVALFSQREIGPDAGTQVAGGAQVMDVAMVDASEIPSGAGDTRIKGLDARMEVWKKTGDSAVQMPNLGEAREGDEIQLRYAVPEKCFGMLFSMDGNGTLTMHMADGSSAVALEPGKMTTLPFAYKLDNAPKFEKFFLLTSRAAFELDANNIDALLKDKDVHNVSITLRKVGGVN
ncbi:MAG: hypothetical protein IKA48_04515 [Fibrobacter sp.]|nr:hypothetical protein [Fibrobacter sp.]